MLLSSAIVALCTYSRSDNGVQKAVSRVQRKLTAEYIELTAAYRVLTSAYKDLSAVYRELTAAYRELTTVYVGLTTTVFHLDEGYTMQFLQFSGNYGSYMGPSERSV